MTMGLASEILPQVYRPIGFAEEVRCSCFHTAFTLGAPNSGRWADLLERAVVRDL